MQFELNKDEVSLVIEALDFFVHDGKDPVRDDLFIALSEKASKYLCHAYCGECEMWFEENVCDLCGASRE